MDSVNGTSFEGEICHFTEADNDCGSDLTKRISIFSTAVTKILNDEDLFVDTETFFNDNLQENVTWYDIVVDGEEEISIGLSTDTGSVYLYGTGGFHDAVNSKKYGAVVHSTRESELYIKMFNLIENIDEDDLEYDSNFMNDFRNKIKKIAADAKK